MYMACGNQKQGVFVPIHRHPLVDPRQPPPLPFFPGLINPNPSTNGATMMGPPPLPPPFPAPFCGLFTPADVARIDEARSRDLLQFMADEGLVPSREEEEKREKAIEKLKQIIMEWIKEVARQRDLDSEHIASASATVLTYGSYGLGVHNSESDIDALCVGPRFATMDEDFFVLLRDMLIIRAEVTEVHCIKGAKVPLMRFKLDGISIDLPYAQLKVIYVPENVDILNPYFLKNMDETSWKSISGVHANKCILGLVPNLEAFQSLLRCVKFWAKRRGVYGNLLGFFGGVHLAILAAFVCQRHPNASLTALIASFFRTFAFWSWPYPIILQDGLPLISFIATNVRGPMPIRLPCKLHEYCHSNITRSTFYKIKQEFVRGFGLCRQDLMKPNFNWACLFEPFSYTKRYMRFLKICLSANNPEELGEWVGWIKSRFRALLIKVEDIHGFCDPNPTEHVDANLSNPNVVFYWGLQPVKSGFLDIKPIRDYFVKCISNNYQGPRGKLTLSVVQASQLPKSAQSESENDLGLNGKFENSDYDPKPEDLNSGG